MIDWELTMCQTLHKHHPILILLTVLRGRPWLSCFYGWTNRVWRDYFAERHTVRSGQARIWAHISLTPKLLTTSHEIFYLFLYPSFPLFQSPKCCMDWWELSQFEWHGSCSSCYFLLPPLCACDFLNLTPGGSWTVCLGQTVNNSFVFLSQLDKNSPVMCECAWTLACSTLTCASWQIAGPVPEFDSFLVKNNPNLKIRIHLSKIGRWDNVELAMSSF